MCLIALALDAHPAHVLAVAANRDERYDRPAAPARFWTDDPQILGGRDERAGGTWMGLRRDGRWAAVTNYRAPEAPRDDAPSRGALVAAYLRGTETPEAYARRVEAEAARYNGFSLLVGRGAELWYVTNRKAGPQRLAPGVHGLSNHLIGTPWPKLSRSTRRMEALLEADAVSPDALLDLLGDRAPAPREALPDTGLAPEREEALSPPFIVTPRYGTRSSTALVVGRDGHVRFAERTFAPGGHVQATRWFSFEMKRKT